MRHLDLFAGIGGFSLAAQWMGWETIAQVEWDEWCQKVLAKNFPDALRFGDIVEFNNMLEDGRITTNTEGAGLLREKELEDNSENNGTGRGCNPSDLHKIYRENGKIITNSNRVGLYKQEKYSTQTEFHALSKFERGGKMGVRMPSIDIITGGFPCQPFSHAGKRKGVDDSRYLWPEMLRTIRILKPSFVVGENVAGLVSMENGKTLDAILADLENEGYQVESFIIPACAVGAWHRRDRIWIIAHDKSNRLEERRLAQHGNKRGLLIGYNDNVTCNREDVPDHNNQGLQGRSETRDIESIGTKRKQQPERYSECNGRAYWESEPSVGRVANGIPNRVDRLKGLGNAIVPHVAYQTFKAIEQYG